MRVIRGLTNRSDMVFSGNVNGSNERQTISLRHVRHCEPKPECKSEATSKKAKT